MADEQNAANAGSESGTGSETAQAQAAAAAAAEKKVQFDADQQALVNRIVDAAYAKAFDKAKEVFTPQVAQLTKEIETLKAGTTKTDEKPKADEKPAADKKAKAAELDVAAIMARLDEVTSVATQLKQEKDAAEKRAQEIETKNKASRVKENFIVAADKFDFFDRMDVFNLVQHDLSVDEETGSVVVINPATKLPRLNSELKSMTLEQYLGDFAKTKPHMVRSKTSDGGTGSSESRKLETKTKSETVDYSKLKPEDFRSLTESVIARQYTDRK